MKRCLMALAALAALISDAHAGCSKAGLAGRWLSDSGGLGIPVRINNNSLMVLTSGSRIMTLKIKSFGLNCRGKGTLTVKDLSNTPYTIKMKADLRSEMVKGEGKPNQLMVMGNYGVFIVLTLIRQP